MMGRTAVLTGQVAWLYATPMVAPDWRAALLGFPLVAIAAYAPDLDHSGSTAGRKVGKFGSKAIRKAMGGHRGGTHSAVIVYAAYVFAGWFLYGSEWAATAVAIGWAAHIFTDLLTVQGVKLFWPLGVLGYLWKPLFVLNRRIHIAWFVTGGTGEVVYSVLILVAGALVGVSMLVPYLPGGIT
jgi:membrane-bound metal-dependent hydrolase YbcI (DUF457 family)